MTDTADRSYSFDARTFALTWLTVHTAASDDDERPLLYRTVNIELDDAGVRLTSTDSSRFWSQWVGEHLTAREPSYKKKRAGNVTISDSDFRARDLMKYIAKATKKEEYPLLVLTMAFGAAPREEGQFVGMERDAITFTLSDKGTGLLHESLLIPLQEGAYPDLRPIFNGHTPQPTDRIAFNPEFLAKMTKAVPGSEESPCTFVFAGPTGPAIIVPFLSEQGWPLRGMLMPVRTRDAEVPHDPATGEVTP